MKLLDTLKAIALVAAIAVMASVCLVLLQLSSAVKHTDEGMQKLAAQAGKVLDGSAGTLGKVDATLDSVNRLCPGPKDPIRPCGVLADLNRTMATIRGTAGEVEKAAIHENGQLTTLDKQQAGLFADLHTVMGSASGTADAATRTLTAATAAIQKGTDAIGTEKPALDALIAAAMKVVTNPDYPVLVHHAAGMSASGDSILADGAYKIHQFAHPDKKKLTFWTGADAFMLYLHSHVVPDVKLF